MVVLRQANGPLTTRQITERVIGRKGLAMKPGKQSKQWITRVRKVCQKIPTASLILSQEGIQVWTIAGRL